MGKRTNATRVHFQKPLFCRLEMNAPSSGEQRIVDRKTHHRRKYNPENSGEKHVTEDDAEVPLATAGLATAPAGALHALYRD
jgi:hypothetical protein